MGNKESKAAGKFDTTAKAKQASTHLQSVAAGQRINIQIVQNVYLIWLDNNIDDSSDKCRNTITQLRRAINTVKTFTDGSQCIAFINSMSNEKACVIISGSLGQYIVPLVHNMSQVDSIFIFCANKEHHRQWAKEWPKIKGVFTEITSIYEALKQTARQCEQNSISIRFMATSGDNSKTNLDELDYSFMYTKILKEILLAIEFEPKHFTEFIQYCQSVFAENQSELQNVDKLQQKYRDQTPIWWYTSEGFLYPMLNRALRHMDVDIIIKLGFFINDLHRQIEQLHNKQFNDRNSNETFKVYRGQGISKTEFEQMNKAKGGLIAFNNFLSTNKNSEVSFNSANSAAKNPDLVGILFNMTIDSSKSTTPFASIIDVSFYKDKEEVLFAMHTVFRINDIKPMGENRHLFLVELTLTNDNDQDLSRLTNGIREKTEGSTEWDQFGELLFKMGQAEKAEQIYQILLEQTTEESEKAHVYYKIGCAKYCLGEFNAALIFSKKALEIQQQSLSPNHPDIAKSHNTIGAAYESMGDYSDALSSHEKSLAIRQQSLPPNHPDLALSYNHIGLVYSNMGKYSKALTYYEKDLEISEKSLPPNHPDLAKSYNNIGLVYTNMSEYSKALLYYEKELEINQQSLPPNHPDLACSYNNIGWVYKKMGEHSKARPFYECAVEIGQRSLPSNHPDLHMYRNKLDRVKKKL